MFSGFSDPRIRVKILGIGLFSVGLQKKALCNYCYVLVFRTIVIQSCSNIIYPSEHCEHYVTSSAAIESIAESYTAV